MENNSQSLDKLAKFFGADRLITRDETEQVFKGVLELLNNFKKENENLNSDTKNRVDDLISQIENENARVLSQAKDINQKQREENKLANQKMLEKLDSAVQEVLSYKAKDGEDGEDADEDEIVKKVHELIKPEIPPVFSLENKGLQIVEEINRLPVSEENQIDFSRIKNVPEFKGSGRGIRTRDVFYYDESTLVGTNIQNIKFQGAGVQVSLDSLGSLIVSISGGAAANESNGETLTPVNGTTFTFAHAPAVGGIRNIWKAETGQLLTPTTDYSISGTTLTTVADQTGFTLIANYTY